MDEKKEKQRCSSFLKNAAESLRFNADMLEQPLHDKAEASACCLSTAAALRAAAAELLKRMDVLKSDGVL